MRRCGCGWSAAPSSPGKQGRRVTCAPTALAQLRPEVGDHRPSYGKCPRDAATSGGLATGGTSSHDSQSLRRRRRAPVHSATSASPACPSGRAPTARPSTRPCCGSTASRRASCSTRRRRPTRSRELHALRVDRAAASRPVPARSSRPSTRSSSDWLAALELRTSAPRPASALRPAHRRPLPAAARRKHVLDRLGHRRVDEVTVDDLRRLVDGSARTGSRRHRDERDRDHLSSLLRYARQAAARRAQRRPRPRPRRPARRRSGRPSRAT